MPDPVGRRSTVELWWTPVRSVPASDKELVGLLDDRERRRAERFRVRAARERFLAARVMLRCLLARPLGLSPRDLCLSAGPHGKPDAARHPAAPQFNLSHSGDVAVVALADRALGVDVEWLRPVPKATRLAERFFAASEQKWLLTWAEADRDRAFLELWTAKEAVVKALGVGLGTALSAIEVDPEHRTVIRSPCDRQSDGPWSLLPADLPVPAVCTVATRGHGARLEVRQFDWRSAEGFTLNVER